MKNRSNRLPSAGAPDDWVNDSWTVDCVCGVNFDDGEEMVDCDECGVWVHTRCSRFVKGEKSFACDKCKSKNSRNGSEETEVAQLLVELPNKTIKMKNSHPLGNPPHRPYKHWTERPIEERVHVQGLPGGDPSLFQGLSSIFSPQLWKCTGYVPKKFDFHYREFPCWNEEQNVPVKVGEDSENLVDKGAGVLYSLSKEIAVSATAEALAGMRGQFSNGRHEKKPSKERKGEGSDVKNIGTQSIMKKERSLLRPFILSCGKRRREDMGTSKDQSGKKRPKALEREHDAERKKTHALKTVVTHPTNGRQVEVYERKAQKVLRADDLKHGNGKDTGSQEVATVAHLAAGSNIEKPKRSVAVDESNLEAASSIMLDHYYSSEKVVKTEKSGRSTSKTPFLPPLMEKDDAGSTLMNEEGVNLNNLERKHGIQFGSLMAGLQKSKDIVEDAVSTAPDVKDVPLVTDTGIDVLMGSLHSDMKAEAGTDVGNHEAVTNSCSKYIDVKVNPSKDLVLEPVLSNNKMAEIYSAANSESSEHKALYVDKGLEAVSDRCSGKADQISENPCTGKPGSVESECPTGTEKSRLDTREVSRVPMETSKLSGGSPSGSLSQWKMVSNGKTSPSSSTILISRSASDKCRTSNSQDSIGKHVTSNSSIHKENTTREPLGNENKYERTRSMNKERAKSSVKPVFKVSQRNMTSQSSVSKHSSLDAGEPSYKASSVESSVHAPVVGETPGSLQVQGASHGQHKRTASGAQQRGEKAVLSNAQSSSKAAQSSSGHLPASSTPAGLSDEELALLLHQELNSSPRVPRVPRVRHAGSLPQLSSASATSMLIKHSSSTGGKDQYSFSRRKSKDVHKDGSHSSREHDSEVRKGDRGPSSPDSAKTADALMHVEANRESLQSARKCTPQASASAANSGPSSSTDANEQDFSTLPRSPVNNSEDDAGTSKVPAHRTLPELIAEIMSKGKRMTYEELCNAVLPHWRNLRKHNGERYAYSSPSQAVLDCLRNRTEWAQLVDRGPKTSASRKRRKIDAETHSAESEEGEERAMKEDEGKSLDSNREEFPKGKRKARKRGRLALQGRGIKDVRSRRKTEVSSSDDGGSSSNSSEESACSDDESQGDGTTGTGSEASASSDEAADML